MLKYLQVLLISCLSSDDYNSISGKSGTEAKKISLGIINTWILAILIDTDHNEIRSDRYFCF